MWITATFNHKNPLIKLWITMWITLVLIVMFLVLYKIS